VTKERKGAASSVAAPGRSTPDVAIGKETLVKPGFSAPRTTSPSGPESSAIERARGLAQLGRTHLLVVESTLVPAYREAVGAMDIAAVKALALQIVGGAARVVDAQSQIIQLVPQADTGPHPANTSTAVTDPGAPDANIKLSTAAADGPLRARLRRRIPRWIGPS
jgi:hypothetical protein